MKRERDSALAWLTCAVIDFQFTSRWGNGMQRCSFLLLMCALPCSCVDCYTERSVALCGVLMKAACGLLMRGADFLRRMHVLAFVWTFAFHPMGYALNAFETSCHALISEEIGVSLGDIGWYSCSALCSVCARGLKDSFYFTVVQVMRNTSHASHISTSSTPLVSVFL